MEGRFAEIGLVPYEGLDGYRHGYAARGARQMTDLLGVVPGREPGLDPILIGAHYDSVIPAPCADDNAAAVAVMLAVAAQIAAEPLRRDLVVAAFDAEEPPHFLTADMGSIRFVDEALAGRVHLAAIMDLVGHPVRLPGVPLDPDLVFVAGSESHPALPELLNDLDLPFAAVAQSRVGDFSDYAAFRAVGAPYLFFSCGEWEHYHMPTDTPDRLDYAKMGRLAGDLGTVLRRADSVATAYHCDHDLLEVEIASLERHIGANVLTAVAGAMGLPGYRTSADLDRIIGGLRGGLR